MKLLPSVPWVFFAATAAVVGLVAHRSGRGWFGWALVGGASSLVVTTLLLGVAEAVFIPISHEARLRFCTKTIVAVVLMNALCGWLMTAAFHRQHLILADLAKRLLGKLLRVARLRGEVHSSIPAGCRSGARARLS